VEPTGSETHLIARAGATQVVAVLRDRVAIQEGDAVRLSLDTAAAHFFDPESGRRLTAA
jgi:multiple sugar transport system ATP-binding protein